MTINDQQADALLEQLMEQQLSQELKESIDWAVLCNLLSWTPVELDRLQDNRHAVDITWWLEEYCSGAYHRSGRKFLFESEKDAVLFQLRWMQ